MKTERLISIIMLLLEHKVMSASKLAEMFEVSPRTIYRDIEAIGKAGIPIVGYPGINGGISIMEEYKIEKKLFTISDISALLIGLGSIHSSMSGEEIMNAMAKLKGLIPFEYRKDVEIKSNQIAIDHTPWIGTKNIKYYFKEIKTAINEQKLITFYYSNRKSEKSHRIIEPYRLVLKESNWYLQGYCLEREDYRIFRLSRMSSLKIKEETFLPRPFDYDSMDFQFRTGKSITTVRLMVDESLYDKMVEYCGEENIKPYDQKKYIVDFPFTEDDYWYNTLIHFGAQCECLEPESIRLELISRIEGILNIYKKNKTELL